MKRRNFFQLAGMGALGVSNSVLTTYSATSSSLRWHQDTSTNLFDQVYCDTTPTVQSSQFGLLQGFCSLKNGSETIQVFTSNKQKAHCGPIRITLHHKLHNTQNGTGEDCLEGILHIQNTSGQSQLIQIGFATSALPFEDRKQQNATLPLTAAGLSNDKRFGLLGSADFLDDTLQVIGEREFSSHYLEPMASNPNLQKTRAMLLAPVIDLHANHSSWHMSLFTSSLEPMEFKTIHDHENNRGWLCSRHVELKPDETITCKCFLLFHKRDASVAWETFHRLAHHEEHEPIEWLSQIRVHYYDFLSSSAPNTRRGGGYESDMEFFKQFHVGMATQHGYYPYLGDFIHPDRNTWKAMRSDKQGAVDMSIEKMKTRIKATREQGAHPAVYLHMVLFDEASPLYKTFQDFILYDPTGVPKLYPWNGPDTVKTNWHMSVASKEWRDHLIQQAEWIMEILNPDAIAIDETFSGLGYDFHPNRSGPLSGYAIELIREIRNVVRSFGSDKALLSSDCSLSNLVMWADGECGDHAYGQLLGHKLYLKEPARYLAALGGKPWRPCAWHFQHFWDKQMELARQYRAGVGVSNGWIEYTGLRHLPGDVKNNMIADIKTLVE